MTTASGDGILYLYNADGIRTSKTVNGVTTNYTFEGSNIVHETNGTDTLWYYYDEGGNLVSFELNGTSYYYVNNLQGDIIAITDNSGNKAVEYVYDSWGKLISTTGTLASTVGVKNPYRYRGYRYDTETGLYYLQSRYYDPEMKRFINADDTSVLHGEPGNVLQYNLFAYCSNNPINHVDEGGYFGTPIQWACAAVGAIAGWFFGDYVAKALGYKSGWKYWAIRTGVVVGGTVIGWFVGSAITKIVTKFLTKHPNICQKLPQSVKKFFGTNAKCFVEGTMVATENGYKPIEEIEVGEWVWATDPETGEKYLKQVLQTFENETDELAHVWIDDEEIVCTPGHKFYSPKKGWTDAIDLKCGDMLQLLNGEYVVVEYVQHEILEYPVKIYNFEVEDFHTYYVGQYNSVLVHNMCMPKNIYNSIRNAPGYSKNFVKARNGLKKVNVNNKKLLSKLNQLGSGWKKVYQNGYINGKKVSYHYFQDKTGKIFDFWVKNGWS